MTEDGSGGTDNPAFSHDEDAKKGNDQQQQTSNGGTTITIGENGGANHSVTNGTSANSTVKLNGEKKIDLPEENDSSVANGDTPRPKLNGVHSNGNNNDNGFLNTTVTSITNNDVNDKKEQIEAVNLELISMKPHSNNHQAKNKEACVPVDPYEQYFVPVNEHKKYMRFPETEVETTVAGVRFDLGPGVGREGLSLRDPAAGLVDYSHWLNALRGEKLYLTKDKRVTGINWKRVACWVVAFVALTALLILGILIGTGVIDNPMTQNYSKENQKSYSQSGDIIVAGSREKSKNPPPSPPPFEITTASWPTTDESFYKIVPQALQGVITFDNLAWDPSMATSRVYRSIAEDIELAIARALRVNNKEPSVKIYSISEDGEKMGVVYQDIT
uniref:SEA domain-containing protein n=1 Tax=Trichogramma kaykai TaxID=54128 RepID=A0ABD2WPF5_9HYME